MAKVKKLVDDLNECSTSEDFVQLLWESEYLVRPMFFLLALAACLFWDSVFGIAKSLGFEA